MGNREAWESGRLSRQFGARADLFSRPLLAGRVTGKCCGGLRLRVFVHGVLHGIEVHAFHALDAVRGLLEDGHESPVATVFARPEVRSRSTVVLEDPDFGHDNDLSDRGEKSQAHSAWIRWAL